MRFHSFKSIRQHTIALLCLFSLSILLASCRSASSTIDIIGEIEPDPIVGEIVTLRIEVISEKFSGDGEIYFQMNDEINFVAGSPEWQETLVTDETATEPQTRRILAWRGYMEANEPQIHEISICVTQPGWWKIIMGASISDSDAKVMDWIRSDLHIVSMVDSAEVIPSSEYEVRIPPFGSTPIPTPEPVNVSAECSGEG